MAGTSPGFRLRDKLFLTLALILGGFGLFSAYLFLSLDRVALESRADQQIRDAAARVLALPPSRRKEGAALAGMQYFAWRQAGTTARPARWLASPAKPRWVDRKTQTLHAWGQAGGEEWYAEAGLADTTEVLRDTSRFLLLATLLNSLAAIAAAGLWLRRLVLNPLARLSRAMQGVGDKTSTFRPLPPQARDEIGGLTHAFNELMGRLQQAQLSNERYIQRLEEAYRSLEEAQERVLTSEKLASLGRLSAGIAHEIGNPLAAIRGYLDLLRRLGPEDHADGADMLARAAAEAARIDRIIRGLLDFARPRAEEAQARPAAEVLVELQQSLAAQPLFKEISIRLAADERAGLIPTGGGRLEQVLINLCVNAADAMDGRGTITLGCRAEGEAVLLWVADTGKGIAREDLPHLFEPFFTTKPPEKGTGLGLAISHQIVTALRGAIEVESAPGAGATFRIRLPRIQE